ncbi:unnamed protein product [Sphagnum compactum]
MCPLRVILLFLSALLAGYFAFQSVTSAKGGTSVFDVTDEAVEVAAATADGTRVKEGGLSGLKVSRTLMAGFWLLVDMLSGRYLWNNLRLQDKPSAEPVKAMSG